MPRPIQLPRPLVLTLLVALTFACCLLSGCAFGKPPTQAVPVVLTPVAVPPPANLLTAPQPLPQPPNGTLKALEQNHLSVAELYHQLATQTCALLQHLQRAHPSAINLQGCAPWLK